MGKTKIEWTRGDDGSAGASWNPIRARNKETGGVGHYCAHVSPGCHFCYAERMQPRFQNRIRYAAQDIAKVDLFLDDKKLTEPLRWRKPRRIFVCSMTDLFGDWVPDAWIDRVFAVMALSPQHTFQVLTKRSARMRAYFAARRDGDPWADAADYIADLIGLSEHPAVLEPSNIPLPNVWLYVSVEDQQRANERIPDLLNTPAAVRGISAEPLLGSLNLAQIDDGAAHRDVPRQEWGSLDDDDSPPGLWWNALTGERTIMHGGATGDWRRRDACLDHVIAGGESGTGARPMHPDWARDLRDQCQDAGTAFFFKQWGEYGPSWDDPPPFVSVGGDEVYGFARMGKQAAGRRLDGREHNDMPRHY